MKTSNLSIQFVHISTAAALALCAGVACTSQTSAVDTPSGPSAQAAALQPAVLLERARVDVDLGRNYPGARASLDALLSSGNLTPREQADAIFIRALAEEGAGAGEAAIASIELLLGKHQASVERTQVRNWTKALRRLLGAAPAAREIPSRAESEVIAPVANAFTRYFPVTAGRDTTVRILRIGGDSEVADALGTFHIAAAISEAQEKRVTAAENPDLHTTESRFSDWTAIPQIRDQMQNALVVLYYAGGAAKIPARYDAILPLSTAEIDARLATGEGLIAVRQRPGAPPVVLLAAPRAGQLASVDKAFSELAELPVGESRVALRTALAPAEIQQTMRGAFSQMRACYNELLARDKVAAGKVVFAFEIEPTGRPKGVVVAEESTLADPTARTCMKGQLEALKFPEASTSGSTTVRYPITFSP